MIYRTTKANTMQSRIGLQFENNKKLELTNFRNENGVIQHYMGYQHRYMHTNYISHVT